VSDADAAEARLAARLGAMGIAFTTRRHTPAFTVEEARTMRGDLPGGHAKNLFLKDKKDRLFLAVVEEGTAVDLKRLEKALGSARLSFGRAELMAEVLGVTPGSVTPFALINAPPGRLAVVIDAALLAQETVNFHPLRNDATTALSPQGLMAFLRGLGHQPMLFDFAGMTPI